MSTASSPEPQALESIPLATQQVTEAGRALVTESLSSLRTKILTRVLIGASVLGGIAYLVVMTTILRSQQWGYAGFYSAAFGVLLLITILRQLPFNLRAGTLLALIYGVGVVSLVERGLNGEGRLFLLAFPALAALFLGLRAGIGALLISVLTAGLVGWLTVSGLVLSPSGLPGTGTWGTTTATLLFLGFIVTFAIDQVLQSLSTSLQHEQTLIQDLEQERNMLQQQVAERALDLERRTLQIRTAAEISRALGALLDQETLLQQMVELVRQRFDLYYVGVFLLDERGEYAVLRAGTGEAGKNMLAARHKLAIGGTSMIGWTTANRKARIALDVGKEAVRFENPYLPLTRSELALPIIAGKTVLGALTIQSAEAEAFDEEDITVLQGIADSLATSLENSRLFAETQANLEEIQSLHRQYLARAWAEVAHRSGSLNYTTEPANAGQLETGQVAATDNANSTLQVPLTLRDQVIGKLTLEADRQAWTPDEKSLVDAVTVQAALALENARLLEETQSRAEREQIAATISTMIWASTDIDTILRTALRELGHSMHASEGAIRLEVSD